MINSHNIPSKVAWLRRGEFVIRPEVIPDFVETVEEEPETDE